MQNSLLEFAPNITCLFYEWRKWYALTIGVMLSAGKILMRRSAKIRLLETAANKIRGSIEHENRMKCWKILRSRAREREKCINIMNSYRWWSDSNVCLKWNCHVEIFGLKQSNFIICPSENSENYVNLILSASFFPSFRFDFNVIIE